MTYPVTRRVGVLVFNDFEPIDVWGFCEAFSIARFLGTGYASTGPYPYELVFIANQDRSPGGDSAPAPVRSYNGPRVAPDVFRDQALEQSFDVLMIPGGQGVYEIFADPVGLQSLLAWTVQMDAKVPLMTSVCTGAAVLAAAGLLDGKPATSNHAAFAWVTSQGPLVLWNNVLRWVDAGRYVTSAGVSSGTDMAFYLVERLSGRAVAETAAISAEYNWLRNPNEPIQYPQQASVPVPQ